MYLIWFYLTFALAAIGLLAFVRGWRMPVYGIVLYYALRLAAVAFLHFSAGYEAFDLHGWYEHAERMLNAEFPGRDFLSPYGLGFNGLLALSVMIVHHPFSIVVAFSLIECIGVVFFKKGFAIVFTHRLADSACWLYMTCPFVINNLGFEMQDEGILVAVMAVMFYVYARRIDWLLPVIAVCGLLLTKVLAVIYMAPFFVMINLKHACRFIALVCMCGMTLVLLGINPLNLRFERLGGSCDEIAKQITCGNFWYLFKPVTGDAIHLIAQFVLLCAVASVLLILFSSVRRRDEEGNAAVLLWAISALGFILVSINKMSYLCYLAPALPFLFTLLIRCYSGKLQQKVMVSSCLFGWYVITSVSIIRKLTGDAYYLKIYSFIFPASCLLFMVFLSIKNVKWELLTLRVVVERIRHRIIGLDRQC